SEALSLRLRAGLILHRCGASDGVAELFVETAESCDDCATRQFAVRHLPEVIGETALPILRELLRGKASEIWGDVQHALGTIGENAVPMLCEMIGEQDQTP